MGKSGLEAGGLQPQLTGLIPNKNVLEKSIHSF